MSGFVFHDPSGRRARRTGLVGGLILAIIAAVVAGFLATLALAPRLPDVQLKDPRVWSSLHQETPRRAAHSRPAWTKVHRRHTGPGSTTLKPLVVGFYVWWAENSRASLAHHIDQLDVLAPMWLTLRGANGAIDVQDDPQAEAIIARAGHRPSILPVVSNVFEDKFHGEIANAVLLNPAARASLISHLEQLAEQRGYSGYIFDFEELSPEAKKAYPLFVAEANRALDPSGREVWATAPFADDDFPVLDLQRAADTVVLMAYDQHFGGGDDVHSGGGAPGPVAGQDWFEAHLNHWMEKLDAAKTIVALGSYGYDWTLKDSQGLGHADTVTFHESTQEARDSEGSIRMDDDALNPTFGYEDEKGRKHTVWFLDAPSVFNQVKFTDDYRPRGYGLWRLGSEDPGVWSVLPHPYGQVSAAGLADMAPGEDVDFDGHGEVLHISELPRPGKRTWQIDPDTGLIADEQYVVTPTTYVIQRYGERPGLVALTFDDGPDPRWTPKILNILKAKHAPATFFVIGDNMQHYPEIVAREVREGHDVGSHTYTHPNIGITPVAETDLELNVTQRLFEVVTGRSMRLFRPPYFGDAEPSTPAEVAPLLTAQKLGYYIVGLRIDPDDWQKPDPSLIVQRTLDRMADTNSERRGQVVLLHDSGGNRSRTVQALPALIDQLRAHGFRLVTVGELAGLTPAQAMPPTQRNSVELMLDRLGFSFFRYLDFTLKTLFITAIVLGVARLAFLATLALVHQRQFKRREPPMLAPGTGPLVSVLIPCFNEEKVIVGSIRRILESRWDKLEVLVLDDGSTDGTAAEVEKAFGAEPRVKILSFPNGGKATALNRGLAETSGEIVVALDADTQFHPDAIARMARWFADPEIGAVAGNAMVGNRLNLITRWQALEYVTAQNLERRALAALGAVTVVPGAIGAWRKSALEALGGYPPDTLAEDQDLTIAIQRAGWRVDFDPTAQAFTEAPDTVAGLLKQRFRWSFGTLQCIFKHRSALFNPKLPALGFVALPQIWLFQILLAAVAPLVDMAVIWSIAAALLAHFFHPVEWSSDDFIISLLYWSAFIFVDLSAGALGMALEKKAPWRDFLWLPVQRFGYRQIMYYVVVKALVTAVRGPIVGWGKLERKATVGAQAAAE